jgi:hypothetical protein
MTDRLVLSIHTGEVIGDATVYFTRNLVAP